MSEVETRTKIRAKYLRAIENEEWDLLPGPVYAKSFLRTYGDYLGLDSRMLVEEYKRRYEGPTDHEPARPIASLARERERERMRGFRGPRLPQWTPIALVLVAIVVVLYLVGTIGGSSSKSPATTPSSASTHHAKHHAKSRHVALPATPASATLQLTATAPVYVCLVNGRGKFLIFEKTYAPGQTIPTFKQKRMLLTLGNANVQVKVNGKPQAIAASSAAIRLLITPTSVQHIAMTVKPTCP